MWLDNLYYIEFIFVCCTYIIVDLLIIDKDIIYNNDFLSLKEIHMSEKILSHIDKLNF